MENFIRNNKLKIELSNNVYDVIDEAIIYMNGKKNYKENDITKLLLAIYKGKYNYVTKDNGYRDQIELLSEYFKKEYDHSLVSLILVKRIMTFDFSEMLKEIIKDDDVKDQILFLVAKEEYNELLEVIENNKKAFMALAKIYEKTCVKGD